MDDLTSFVAEILARETADMCYFRVRAGAKTASMQTVESEIPVPDSVDEATAAITDALSRCAADPSNKIAYVEAVDRSQKNAVVKRLPIRLDDDDGTLNVIAASTKGSDPAGILAIELVRGQEGWRHGFNNLLEKYMLLMKEHQLVLLNHQALVADATVRAEVEDKIKAAEGKAQVLGMIQMMAPSLNLAVGKALGVPYEQIVSMMGGTPGAQGEAEPPPPVDGPAASEGTPDEVADRTVDRLIWLVQNHPECLTEERMNRAKPAIMSVILGTAGKKPTDESGEGK